MTDDSPTAYVLWFGGGSYAPPYVEADTLTMPLDDVIEFCQDRYVNRDGTTPCVDETSSAWVFLEDPRTSTDPYPDHIVERKDDEFKMEAAG